MTEQPFYAVRVVVKFDDGSSAQRDYVRSQHMGRETFSKFALGDLLALVSDGTSPVRWRIEEIDFNTVVENRKYHHTTH